MKNFKKITAYLLTAAVTLSLCAAIAPFTSSNSSDSETIYEVMPIDSDYPDADWI